MVAIEHAIVEFLSNLFTSVGWAGVVIAMAIESACIPLPSEVTLPLAGWLRKARSAEADPPARSCFAPLAAERSTAAHP